MTTTSRLPTQPPVPPAGRWRHRARGITAALVLLVLLGGVPFLLAWFIGNPLPGQLPTAAAVRHDLVHPLTDGAVIRVLAAVAWLAWAHLLVSVTVEAVTQLRGAPAPRRVPLLAVNQALAHRLVASVLLLVPAAAATAPMAALTRAAATPYPDRPAATAAAVLTARTTAPTRQPPSPSDGRGRPLAPAVPAQPARPQPHKVYVVRPPHGRHYDSLWDIAARHLGDGRRYREIYALNRGRPQPGGGELTTASLIQPGWVLLLPADATGPGVLDPQQASPPPPRPASTGGQPAGPAQPVAAPTGAAADVARPRDPLPPDDAPAAPTSATRPAPVAADPPPAAAHRPPVAPVAIGLGVGSLAALAALTRARRVAQRRRPFGMRPAPVPDDLRGVEAGLRAEARQTAPVAGVVRLAVALAGHRDRPVAPRTVLHHDDGTVDLVLDDPPTAPAPFVDVEAGWRLPADAAGFAFAVADHDPTPALLQLGRAGDADVHVDLYQLGLVAVDGDDTVAVAGLLATLATRLVGAPWAARLRVLVPDWLAGRVGDLEHVEAVTDLAAREAALTAAGRRAGAPPAPDVSADKGAAAEPGPLTVLVGWPAEELPAAVARAAADRRVPLLAVVAGTHPDAVAWRLDGDELTGAALPVAVTVPARPAAADQVAVLLEHTRTAPPVPATDPAYVDLRAETPAAPEPHAAAAMSVNVLGPVELQGIETPRRTPAFQTLVYLALHRRGVTADQLATALWPDELAAGKSIRNRVAEARAVVDGAISDGPGWRLDERVSCDWQRFEALAAGSWEDRLAALDLVRGQPFDGFTDEWVDTDMLRTDIIAAVIDLAAEVAERALADDRPAVAFRAARAGLRASPYEERLFRLAMRAADAEGSTGKLRALMEELRRVLDVHIEPDDEMQRETITLYEELTSAARRRERV